MSAGHLVRRFVGSLSPRAPTAAEMAWAESHLLVEEAELWRRLGRADRRHVVGVARRVEAALGTDATRPVLAAALLHDIGKLESHLSTYGRVVATLSIKVAGPELAEAWAQTRGFTRRVGLYAQHEVLGAEMLELAGSDPVTVALVRDQSTAAEESSASAHLLDAVRAADDT